MSDKTEPPSEIKLASLREEGEAFSSPQGIVSLQVACVLIALGSFAPYRIKEWKALFLSAGDSVNEKLFSHLSMYLLVDVIIVLVIPPIIAIVTKRFIRVPFHSWKNHRRRFLKKRNRIAMRGGALLVPGMVGILLLYLALPNLLSLFNFNHKDGVGALGHLVQKLLFLSGGILLFSGALQLLVARLLFFREHRMSTEELREEE